MYKRILCNKNLPLKERLKRFVTYFRLRRGAGISWKKRFSKVFEIHPEFRTCAEKSIEKTHSNYWRPFRRSVNLATLRVCRNISGISDPKYIPEEIFVSDIEPTLNNTSTVEYLSYKSFYNRWFPGNIFPKDFFHNVDGEWLNSDLNHITFDDVKHMAKRLNYPVVLKPNRDSYGGRGVQFLENEEQLVKQAQKLKDFLVQEKIRQHPFFEQFNSHGINTLRVYIYRSVKDNQLHIINIVLRMGKGGTLDNETAGGILTMIRKDGFLNGFAVDKYGVKFYTHPDSGANFNQKIIDFDGLIKLSKQIAHKIFYARLIGLDVCYDSEGKWRMIEINNFSGAIRLAQYHGALFFGDFSDEVYAYCKSNHWALKSY